MEPPVSVPVAAGVRPPATAAAEPPDEPPGLRVASKGLPVAPNSGLSVTPPEPHHGTVCLADDDGPCSLNALGPDAIGIDDEILQGGRYGQLIHVGSADAISEAIETTLLQSHAAEEMANAAQTHITENWSAQNAANRLEQVLMRCAKRGNDSCP